MCGELAALDGVRPWSADRITAPAVLGVGGRANAQQRRAVDHVAAVIPGSELVVLAGCGHDAPVTAPGQVAGDIVRRAARRAGPPWADAAGA
jgi:pimeloyl-ACP methyl ester carboxylesterase